MGLEVIPVPGTVPAPVEKCSTQITIQRHRATSRRPARYQVWRSWTREVDGETGWILRGSESIGVVESPQEAWDLAKRHGPSRLSIAGARLTAWLKKHKVTI